MIVLSSLLWSLTGASRYVVSNPGKWWQHSSITHWLRSPLEHSPTTPHCQSQSNTSLISSDHSLLLHYTGVYPVVVDNMHQCPDSGVFSGQNWEKYYLITGLSAHHWSPQSSSQHWTRHLQTTSDTLCSSLSIIKDFINTNCSVSSFLPKFQCVKFL